MVALGVFVAGGLGAFARYRLEGVIAPRQGSPFPLSTLVINVTGSAVLGFVVGWWSSAPAFPSIEVWIGVGFVGGYTTFSTFTYETLSLIQDGAWRYVVMNLALSGPLSFAAAATTYFLARGLR
jgi:fluoride exporter